MFFPEFHFHALVAPWLDKRSFATLSYPFPMSRSIFHLHLPIHAHRDDSHGHIEEQLLQNGDIEKISSVESPHLAKVTSPNGVFPFFRPTRVHLHIHSLKLDWSSRDHRKGRHPVEHGKRRTINTFLRIEYWNISWWVAFVSFPFGPVTE